MLLDLACCGGRRRFGPDGPFVEMVPFHRGGHHSMARFPISTELTCIFVNG